MGERSVMQVAFEWVQESVKWKTVKNRNGEILKSRELALGMGSKLAFSS